jgi:iron complex transport system permease protein
MAATGEGTLDIVGRPAAAFLGAAVALVLLFALARLRGRTESHALLLVGVVVNSFVSAILLFLISVGDPARFQGVLFFLVGKLDSISWTALSVMSVVVLTGLATLLVLGHTLNILSLGEEEAGHLGVAAESTTWLAVLAASLVTAASVAFTGVIGFVGLIVPHAVRAIVGPDHRTLLPVSALGGAAFLVLADTVARTVAAPAEIPVGAVTALIGGPFFLVLLFRRLRSP